MLFAGNRWKGSRKGWLNNLELNAPRQKDIDNVIYSVNSDLLYVSNQEETKSRAKEETNKEQQLEKVSRVGSFLELTPLTGSCVQIRVRPECTVLDLDFGNRFKVVGNRPRKECVRQYNFEPDSSPKGGPFILFYERGGHTK